MADLGAIAAVVEWSDHGPGGIPVLSAEVARFSPLVAVWVTAAVLIAAALAIRGLHAARKRPWESSESQGETVACMRRGEKSWV